MLYRPTLGALTLAVCACNGTDVPDAPEAPEARDDALVSIGNAVLTLDAEAGLLANDRTEGGTVVDHDAASAEGGAVTVSADGGFTYAAPVGFVGTDTFSYILGNDAREDAAIVTVTLSESAWFVDNRGPAGDGTQGAPFADLNAAFAAARPGDTVFVFAGDGTATGQDAERVLPAGVRLLGEGVGLWAETPIVPVGNPPVITGPLVLSGANAVAGLVFDGGSDNTDAIQANDVDNVEVSDCTFRNSEYVHLELNNVGGTVVVSRNRFESTTQDESFVDLLNATASGDYTFTDNTFIDAGDNDPSEGVRLSQGGADASTLRVSGNSFTSDDAVQDSFDSAVRIDVYGAAEVTAEVTDNTFVDAGETSVFLGAR